MNGDTGTHLKFLELFGSLPTGGFTGNPSRAFGPSKAPDPFVAPTLRVVVPSEDPAVLFVSARGATGKSFFAAQVSGMKGVPLWRLEHDVGVSAHAFDAKLREYSGPDGPSAFLADNDAFVVIDALDEARMRVSGVSWGEFLDSLVPYLQSSLRLVLLGRERIVEDVWLHLADAGVDCRWVEISHFDAGQRVDYVNARVEHRGGKPEGPVYEAARDAVLTALAGTVDASLSEAS